MSQFQFLLGGCLRWHLHRYVGGSGSENHAKGCAPIDSV